nr:glycosyltransferase [Cytophagales bacterium]
MVILEIFATLCCFYLVFPFITGLVAYFLPDPVKPVPVKDSNSDFACVITVYKELGIAWPLVTALLKQKYPHFRIYLVADAVEPTSAVPSDPKFSLFFPTSPLNSKVASLHYALERMESTHTHVVVFDPDNLVPAHSLDVVDRYHQHGFAVVQIGRAS